MNEKILHVPNCACCDVMGDARCTALRERQVVQDGVPEPVPCKPEERPSYTTNLKGFGMWGR